MKHYAFLLLMIVALAGCTTTYKGSIKGAQNQDASKSNRDVASQSAPSASEKWARFGSEDEVFFHPGIWKKILCEVFAEYMNFSIPNRRN